MARLAMITLAAIAAGLTGQGLMSEGQGGVGHSAIGSDLTDVGCNIKGNISMNTGEHIYHVPGQEHYDETIITTAKGERWFCSEDTARNAGWRKAMR